MPDGKRNHMALVEFIRPPEIDPWTMFSRSDFTPPPMPALENKNELISHGRFLTGGIMRLMNQRGFTVNIRPPKWTDNLIWINTEDHHAAQFVVDALFHYTGRPHVHFPGADFRYPPLFLNTGECLTSREKCSAYVAKIAKGSALLSRRKDFKECVQKFVLGMIKSPEVVQFLNSVRKNPCQVPHFDASKCGNLVLKKANSELEGYSTPAVDVEEEHWKPVGIDVKEAAIFPLVKQYFRDDHNLDVSLLHSFLTAEDDKGGIVLSTFNIPSSASPSTVVRSLVEATRSWRSQREKTLLVVKLLPTECNDTLYPSLKVSFSLTEHSNHSTSHVRLRLEDLPIDKGEASDKILVQDLLAHVQPEQVEESSSVSSYTWKKRRRIFNTVVADLPSYANCLKEPSDKPDAEFEAMDIPIDEEVSSGESGASLESHTEIASADSHGPRTEPSRKRSAACAFYDDNLFAQIRSYVNQQIEEALLPLISALRSREEDEHKHRQKMLALEQEKLALMRQKLECTRRTNAVPDDVASNSHLWVRGDTPNLSAFAGRLKTEAYVDKEV